jgi:hypothetical protein
MFYVSVKDLDRATVARRVDAVSLKFQSMFVQKICMIRKTTTNSQDEEVSQGVGLI